MSLLGTASAKNAAHAAGGFTLSWLLPLQSIGYDPAVIFTSLLGTGVALLRDPPSLSRKQFYAYAVGVTAASASLVALMVDIGTVSAKVGPPLGFLFAYFSKVSMSALERGIVRRLENGIGGGPPE